MGMKNADRAWKKAIEKVILVEYGQGGTFTQNDIESLLCQDPTFVAGRQEHWRKYGAGMKDQDTFEDWFDHRTQSTVTYLAGKRGGRQTGKESLLERIETHQRGYSLFRLRVPVARQTTVEEQIVLGEEGANFAFANTSPLQITQEPAVDVVLGQVRLSVKPESEEPFFTVWARDLSEGVWWSRHRVQAADKAAAAQKVSGLQEKVDVIEVYVHEGSLFEFRMVEAL